MNYWIQQITDLGKMVWYSAENESLNGTDLSENPMREIRELIQGLLP